MEGSIVVSIETWGQYYDWASLMNLLTVGEHR